jgi:ribosomal protein L11 methyltransferase
VIRLALRVRRADAELVLADLLELAPGGVEEVELPSTDGGEGIVEYAVYGAPGELPDLPDLRVVAGGALVEISTSEVLDDWAQRWRQFHRPVLIEPPAAGAHTVPALYVRPPWEPAGEQVDVHDIVIDPAQAFGTGAHATTRLCLQLMLELAVDGPRGAVIDIGSGSGVLAIAAAKLGYGPVVALDNDRESIAAVADNAVANGVHVDARRFDLRHDVLPEIEGMPAPVVLANLLRPLLLQLADAMPILDTSGRLDLICGGLLCGQADEVAGAFATRCGLRERARREQAEWAALWLTSARSPRVSSP